jgi:hypothetical protein
MNSYVALSKFKKQYYYRTGSIKYIYDPSNFSDKFVQHFMSKMLHEFMLFKKP